MGTQIKWPIFIREWTLPASIDGIADDGPAGDGNARPYNVPNEASTLVAKSPQNWNPAIRAAVFWPVYYPLWRWCGPS